LTDRPERKEGASAPSSAFAAADPAPWLRDHILYQDDHTLVIDKPAGLAVHPGPRTPESLEALLPSLRLDRRNPPQAVHRLDRDTSGCLVLGRTSGAVKRLNALFAVGQVEKTYWAIVRGIPTEPEGIIDRALLKHNDRTGWRMVANPNGLAAVTHYRVLGQSDDAALLELQPKTGRTHQIRIHCALIGCPVMDDPIYGTGDGSAPHRLHARRIVIPAHAIDVTAPVPPEMAKVLERLGLAMPA